jgi:flagellar hook-basal body complex protein FliE
MDANIARAAGAYQNKMSLMEGVSSVPSLTSDLPKASFADALGSALQSAVDVNVRAEKMQMQALTGNVEITDLVTAISEAELALSTVVNVRDRVIAAYQEIIRMPI